jgi:hypothetical protein
MNSCSYRMSENGQFHLIVLEKRAGTSWEIKTPCLCKANSNYAVSSSTFLLDEGQVHTKITYVYTHVGGRLAQPHNIMTFI